MNPKESEKGYTIDRHIRVDDPYDVQLWSLVLGVMPQTLVDAVHQVGDDAQDVKALLASRSPADLAGGKH